MKVEIMYEDGSPAVDMLEIYTHPSGLRPIARIWADDFYELLSPAQAIKFESGSDNYVYDVKKSELLDKAKEIFPLY